MYIGKPKDGIRKLLELMRELSKVAGYKINIQKSLAFLCTQFSSDAQSCLTLCDPLTTACQASLSKTNSWSLLKLMSQLMLMMPTNYLILCCTLLLCLQSFPASGAFHESAFRIRWPKYWSFSFNINPSNKYSGLILDLLQPKGLSRVFSNTTVQKHQFFSALISL